MSTSFIKTQDFVLNYLNSFEKFNAATKEKWQDIFTAIFNCENSEEALTLITQAGGNVLRPQNQNNLSYTALKKGAFVFWEGDSGQSLIGLVTKQPINESDKARVVVFTPNTMFSVAMTANELHTLQAIVDVNLPANVGVKGVVKMQELGKMKTIYQPFNIRNKEEKQGIRDMQTNGIPLEDYFIQRSVWMHTIWKSFILNLNSLSTVSLDNIDILTNNLFKKYVETLQAPLNILDDRPLYWARLKMSAAIKSHPFFISQVDNYSNPIPNSNLALAIKKLEYNTRNYNVSFTEAPQGAKKVLITGYDPFDIMFYSPLEHNPSGAVATSLHGKILTFNNNNITTEVFIQSILLPIRYRDFDSGIIEDIIQSHITNIDLILTISLIPSGTTTANYCEIDRFAVKNRGGSPDNENININDSRFSQIAVTNPSLFQDYYETSLPFFNIISNQNMVDAGGNAVKFPIRLNQRYNDPNNSTINYPYYIDKQDIINNNLLSEIALKNLITIPQSFADGSGGNFLSNEVFYRVSRLRTNLNPTLKSGHIHIPQPNINTASDDIKSIVENIKDIIQKSV